MAVYHLLNPKNYIPQAEKDKRRAICNGCDRRNPRLDKCRVCGCLLNLKIKLAQEECPEGKWKKWKKLE